MLDTQRTPQPKETTWESSARLLQRLTWKRITGPRKAPDHRTLEEGSEQNGMGRHHGV